MNFVIDSGVIKKLISNVSGSLSKDKNSVLSNYLVSIKDGVISITASNSVVQATTTAPVKNDITASFLAKPDLFERLKMLNGDISFELKENLLTIKNGFYKTTAKVLGTEDYPLQSINDYETAYSFDASDILELIKTNIACSKEEEMTREFNGVLIDINQKNINFVATNRARLFWVKKPIEDNIEFYCIAEKDSILQLGHILKADDKINLLYKGTGNEITSIAFQMTDTHIISKTIKGRFPQYRAVTLEDTQNLQCITFDRESLKSALNRVLVLSNDDRSIIEFNIQETNAQVNVTNQEGEIASDVVDFTSCNHTPVVLMINGKYILDFLNTIQLESVNFYYQDAKKPIEFKATSESSVNYIYVMTLINS